METLADLLCFGFILFLLTVWLGLEILKQSIKMIIEALKS